MRRYLLPQIEKDLQKKMVFLSGPRQVGKTTLARTLLTNDLGYLNWDTIEGRDAILRRDFPPLNSSYSTNYTNIAPGEIT